MKFPVGSKWVVKRGKVCERRLQRLACPIEPGSIVEVFNLRADDQDNISVDNINGVGWLKGDWFIPKNCLRPLHEREKKL